jgi:hypothetical protein
MRTFTFTKNGDAWYMASMNPNDQKNYEETNSLLEGSATILNLLAGTGTTITLNLDTEPFENAEVLELMQLCHPFLDGGYYYMRLFAGQAIDYKVWMCDVPRYAFGSIPDRIYLRKT